MDQLEQYFRAEGYIVDEEPLSEAEIRARLLGIASGASEAEKKEKVDRFLQRLEWS